MEYNVLAVDLGATSGRGIVFTFDCGAERARKEVYRFPSVAYSEGGKMYWDARKLYDEVCNALRKAIAAYPRIDGVGIDSWGVDYGIIGRDGELICNPRCYRDAAHTATRNAMANRAGELYKIAGIADNDFNTTYQLATLVREGFDFTQAKTLLFIPQLIGYLLTGNKATEPTIASTSGFYDRRGGFDKGFLEELGIPSEIFPEVMPTGAVLGYVKKELKEALGAAYDIPVILSPGHDTACAVSAVENASCGSPLYLSSGTWSLFGTLLDVPVVTREAFLKGYTNELASSGKVRFLKNIMGMWIIEECMREWRASGRDIGHGELIKLASEADCGEAHIDVNDGIFLQPGNMAERVAGYVRAHCGRELVGEGETALCVYRSLARAYKDAYDDLARIVGKKFDKLYVVGGGARNGFLNSLTERELGIPVIALETEASALGNAFTQYATLVSSA